MLHDCRKLHHGHLERAIAADSHHLPVHVTAFGTHRSRDGISHRPHSARGEETSFFYNMIITAPDLILSDISNIHGIFLHFMGEHCDKSSRVYIGRVWLALLYHCLAVFFQRANPRFVFTGKFLFGHILENMSGISHQRNRRANIFANLNRVHVNMYQHFIGCDEIRLADSSVRHTRPHHNQEIGFIHGAVRIGFAIVANHPKIHRVLRGHHTDSHHGRYHRNPVFICKCTNL